MTCFINHPFRLTGRLIRLGAEFVLAAFNYVFRCAFLSPALLPSARATWLQSSSRRVLRVLRIEIKTTGDIPSAGLLVCNHLSYVDIIVLASLAPCVFIAKHEVKSWPVFGWFAKLAGTAFTDRERRIRAGHTVDEIKTLLEAGALVVLFPEGTSSGGQTVLPFKSSLLEPVTRHHHSLTAGFLHYELADGNVSEEVCYWKDMKLVPHLINLCSKCAVHASVQFNQLRERSADRKQLARKLHTEILRMKHAFAC